MVEFSYKNFIGLNDDIIKIRTAVFIDEQGFLHEKTPQVGLEPTAYRLTAGCSAIELLRNNSTVFNLRNCIII